jgi:diadenylate cyclase
MIDLLNEILFLFQRLNWLSVIDLLLVTIIFYAILLAMRDTKAIVLLRGVFFLVILIALLTTVVELPAFSWLTRNSMPALLLAIPVIFAPEIRRALERLGRAGGRSVPLLRSNNAITSVATLNAVVTAAMRLSKRKHGALIILQRSESLQDYIRTGIQLQARVTPELLLQVFYPNTPLHDGAAIIIGDELVAAACVMPLSPSGVLNRNPDHKVGLRHRAALGISESSDAITVVVSEETGGVSVVQEGNMIRRVDAERLENILLALFYPSGEAVNRSRWLAQLRHWLGLDGDKEK